MKDPVLPGVQSLTQKTMRSQTLESTSLVRSASLFRSACCRESIDDGGGGPPRQPRHFIIRKTSCNSPPRVFQWSQSERRQAFNRLIAVERRRGKRGSYHPASAACSTSRQRRRPAIIQNDEKDSSREPERRHRRRRNGYRDSDREQHELLAPDGTARRPPREAPDWLAVVVLLCQSSWYATYTLRRLFLCGPKDVATSAAVPEHNETPPSIS